MESMHLARSSTTDRSLFTHDKDVTLNANGVGFVINGGPFHFSDTYKATVRNSLIVETR